jgi:phage shock protein A
MSDAERLARIENKLDEMSRAIVALARVEERIAMMYNGHERHAERIQKVEEHLNVLDTQVNENGITRRFGERMFWIFVTALVGLSSFYFK